MKDEGKLNADAVRGSRAEELLKDELLQESFETLRKSYTSAWATSAPHERESREYFWRALQVLTDVENQIKKVARDGRVAKKELEDLANQSRRA